MSVMLLSHPLKICFIHNPKTGGSALKEALLPIMDLFEHEGELGEDIRWQVCNFKEGLPVKTIREIGKQDYTSHTPWWAALWCSRREAFKKIPPLDDYFRFAFVRNPWARVASFYTFERKNPKHPHHKTTLAMTFREWIEDRCRNSVKIRKEEELNPTERSNAHGFQSRLLIDDPFVKGVFGTSLQVRPYHTLRHFWANSLRPYIVMRMDVLGLTGSDLLPVELPEVNVSRGDDWRDLYYKADRNIPYEKHPTKNQVVVMDKEDFDAFPTLASDFWFPSWQPTSEHGSDT